VVEGRYSDRLRSDLEMAAYPSGAASFAPSSPSVSAFGCMGTADAEVESEAVSEAPFIDGSEFVRRRRRRIENVGPLLRERRAFAMLFASLAIVASLRGYSTDCRVATLHILYYRHSMGRNMKLHTRKQASDAVLRERSSCFAAVLLLRRDAVPDNRSLLCRFGVAVPF